MNETSKRVGESVSTKVQSPFSFIYDEVSADGHPNFKLVIEW